MTLIKKIINFYNHNSNADYESTFVINDYNGIMIKLNKLRKIIDNLSKLRKKNQAQEREELIDHLYRTLYYVKGDYKNYLFDLYDLKNFLKLNLDIKLKKKIQNQIDVALKTKSMLRKEFETIYNNFTNTAKNNERLFTSKRNSNKDA